MLKLGLHSISNSLFTINNWKITYNCEVGGTEMLTEIATILH